MWFYGRAQRVPLPGNLPSTQAGFIQLSGLEAISTRCISIARVHIEPTVEDRSVGRPYDNEFEARATHTPHPRV